MKNIRFGLIGLGMLLCTVAPAAAQVSFNIGFPNVGIGINLPMFPELIPVPGYPVYYAPGIDGNYFFYDGMYWVLQDDNWYASSWYNGPWEFVAPEDVPLFVLRVPVRYYRHQPLYFRGWMSDESPRWGDHWGREWEQRRSGWDRWDRHAAPSPAPLPVYQRKYAGDRYPHKDKQQTLQHKNYRYAPRELAVLQHQQKQLEQAPASAPQKQNAPAKRLQRQPEAPATPSAQKTRPGGDNVQRATPAEAPQKQRGQAGEERQQPPPPQTEQQQRGPARNQRQPADNAQHDRQAPIAQGQGQGKNKDDEERGQSRNR